MRLKGATLLAEIIALLFMIGAGYFLGGAIIWFRASTLGGRVGPDYALQLEPGFVPIRHEDMLLALLEVSHPKYPEIKVKDILVAAAVQNSTDVYLKGKWIEDINKTLEDMLTGWASGEPYLLQLVKPDGNLRLVWNTANFKAGLKIVRIQKAAVRIFTPSANCRTGCELQLLVRA